MGERLREFLIANPFRPYTVKLRNGQTYSIMRGGGGALSPSLRLFYIADVEGLPFISVRVDDIEQVEAMESAATAVS